MTSYLVDFQLVATFVTIREMLTSIFGTLFKTFKR